MTQFHDNQNSVFTFYTERYLNTLVKFAGHFLLTNLLLDKMKETAKESGIEGRIVNLSSIAHLHTYADGIQFDHINDKNRYMPNSSYTKL